MAGYSALLRAPSNPFWDSSCSELPTHPQPPFCINRPAECILRRSGCFLPAGTPGGGVQNLEYSASRSPQVRERVHKTALNALVLDPQCLKDRSFFTGCGPQCLPFAQNPVCRHPRLLNTPKNARRILPQAPAARRRIASASLVIAGGPRAYLPNLSAGRKDPAARSARRDPDMSEDDLGGKPWASDESSSSRGYSSPKLMPSALASRTRSLWGSTYLSLPATSSSGMWHILPSRRAIM